MMEFAHVLRALQAQHVRGAYQGSMGHHVEVSKLQISIYLVFLGLSLSLSL